MVSYNIILIPLLLSCIQFDVRVVDAKEYMRCQLARELLEKYRINKTFLPSWVCMIEHESKGNTKAVTQNMDGSMSYGLFQINNKDWCRPGRKGGQCNMKCEDFLDDNIGDDLECALKIFNNAGFKNWPGWRKYCHDLRNLPDLRLACKIQTVRPSLALSSSAKSKLTNIFNIK